MTATTSFQAASIGVGASLLTLALLGPAQAQPAPSPAPAPTPRAGVLAWTTYEVRDPHYGGMRVGSLRIPAGWQAQSQVKWDYGSANYPVKVHVRVQSPDGKMWMELLPMDAVYWLTRTFKPIPVGQRSFGAVYAPNATIEQVLQHMVVQPLRGQMPGFQIVGKRPVDAARLAQAFKLKGREGEAMAMKVRYTMNGAPVDEEFYTFYAKVYSIPYSGPQGQDAEFHRHLLLNHSVGATDGMLPSVYPLLGAVAASIEPDPAYARHIQAVQQHITAQFNAALQRGYDSIAAAGQISRTISANNDALLSSMQQQRAAQQRADATRRTAVGSGGGGGSSSSSTDSTDGFGQYIRGTTRLEDPYWGTSERDSSYSHHWTDGQGNYRASNDGSFNPNVGAGGGATWQRMGPAR